MAFATPRVGLLLVAALTAAGAADRVSLYRTTEGGRSWRRVQAFRREGGAFGLLGGSLAMRGGQGEALTFLGPGGCSGEWQVWHSGDGGRSWRAGPRFGASDGPGAIAIGADGATALIAACATTAAFAFRVGPGGAVRPVAALRPRGRLVSGPAAVSLAPTGWGLLAAVAYMSPTRWGAGRLAVLASRDGGRTWRAVAFRHSLPAGTPIALSVPEPNVALLVIGTRTGYAVMATDDGGRLWRRTALPRALGGATLSMPTAATGLLLVRETPRGPSVLLETTDGGLSWQHRALPAGI